ncbi:4-hydroxybenzoate 3-monooxygenase [Enemella dayhoffiae]|uniref:4-hydroxybenzoate 3-monooxygenase n=1 Tax=Enemella dayhoffiae TaxID=2016507 RepID=A0A255GYW0_9ACTN|nr:4-hydroxybenzoate 3-monooxygenase [Enemella dayhoffiae]OYO20797.1 4-hydroxybenzoate 3-monooxygenase [Enemella dayhoffiae]
MKMSVVIIGAGPAGLLLGRLLSLAGVDNIILELRNRQYVEDRIRAGMLEHPTVQLLEAAGVADRLHRQGQFDEGFELRFEGDRIWLPTANLTGGHKTVLYPQQEVVKDLLDARDKTGEPIVFEAGDVALHEVDSDHPWVTWTDANGAQQRLEADYIAGCDGFHGVARQTIPAKLRKEHQRDYPFGWLGILADVPPSTRELIYAHHDNGFAMHSRRSPTLSRLYLQVTPDCDAQNVSDERIWSELQTRLATRDDWTLAEGRILSKSVTAMRSFVVEPLQYGRLFLAGDAAHIVPPTAAKGLNLAVADISVLSEALIHRYRTGDSALLDGYSAKALDRIWRAQEFSRHMTDLLHHVPGRIFDARLQRSRVLNLISSESAMAAFAEIYVGLPFGGNPERFL